MEFRTCSRCAKSIGSVLNAIVWTANGEVPAGGVVSKVTAEDLTKNLDPKGKR